MQVTDQENISGICMGFDIRLPDGLTLFKDKIEKLDSGGP